MASIRKNLNLYWLACTSLAIWFLFVHSPPILVQRNAFHDYPFAIHIMGAYTIYICCILNTIFTPSTFHGSARPFHTLIGRVGMIGGLLSFSFGAYCSWWPGRTLPPRGFAIGITIAGIFQIHAQYSGYTAIRKYKYLKKQIEEIEATAAASPDDCSSDPIATVDLQTLKNDRDSARRHHIMNMLAVFVLFCGVPAGIRLTGQVGITDTFGLISSIVILRFLFISYGKTFFKDIGTQAEDTTVETALLSGGTTTVS